MIFQTGWTWSLHWESKNEVNQMEPLKVIFEKAWRFYEVPDPGKGQIQSLFLKEEKKKGESSELKTNEPSQEKILTKHSNHL